MQCFDDGKYRRFEKVTMKYFRRLLFSNSIDRIILRPELKPRYLLHFTLGIKKNNRVFYHLSLVNPLSA